MSKYVGRLLERLSGHSVHILFPVPVVQAWMVRIIVILLWESQLPQNDVGRNVVYHNLDWR